jgi:hypothetical protein
MISRAWMLLAAALVSPAWSQEAVAPHRVVPESFDLRSESLQKIVRDTVATQFAPARLVEEPPAKQKPAPPESITFASASTPAPSHQTSALHLPAPARRRDGILSGLIDTLLDHDEDLDLDGKIAAKSFCLASNADKTSVQRDQSCGR